MAHRVPPLDAAPARAAWVGPVLLVVVVGGLAVAADFVDATSAATIRLVAGLVAVTALVWGAWHRGASARGAWLLIALGIGGWVVGDVAWDALDIRSTSETSVWYDVVSVGYLSMYPVIFVALIWIVHARGRRFSLDNLIDSAIGFLAVVLLVQVLLINPNLDQEADIDWFSVLYPFGDALLLAAIGWLVFTQGRRNACAWLLGAGMVVLMGADAAWQVTALSTFTWLELWVNPLYPISYALVAAAVLHPAADHIAEPGDAQEAELHPARATFLVAALTTIPVAAFLGTGHQTVVQISISTLVAAVAIRLVALMHSIEQARHEAAASARRFLSLAAAAPVPIFEGDADFNTAFANDAANELVGRPAQGMSAEQLISGLVDTRDQPTIRQAVADVRAGKRASVQVRFHGPACTQRWVMWTGVPVHRGPGPFAGAFVATTDITAVKEAEETLALLATHDALTGLPNRRLLLDRLTTAITRLGRVPGALAVLFLDLDGFKQVNDTHGHGAGDELLKLVANRILHTVRAEDVVARIGGDEFVVVLQRVSDQTTATTISDKILRAIEEPASLVDADVTISASVGITLSSDPHVDPDALIREADAAMYRAKQAGHGLIRVHADATGEQVLEPLIRLGTPAATAATSADREPA